jgi:PAS domain S-box-containing protein
MIVNTKDQLTFSMEHFHHFLEMLPLGATIHDKGQSTPLFVNSCLLQALGYQFQDFAEGYHTLFPKNFSLRLEESFFPATNASEFTMDEVQFRAKDGQAVYFTVSSVYKTIQQQQVLVSFYRDVTDKVKTQSLLARKEKSLKDAQQVAKMGNWDWSPPLPPFYSDELLKIYGFSSGSEFTFEAFQDLLHPQDREAVTAIISKALYDYIPYSIHYRIVMPSGEIKYLHSMAKAFQDTSGKTDKMVGTVQDITLQVQTRQALERSENSLKEAQRIAKVGNWEWDIAEDKRYYSDELLQIYGLLPDTVTTYYQFTERYHPDDKERVFQTMLEAIQTFSTFNIEHRIILPGGELKYVHATSELFLDKHGRPAKMIGTVQDITQHVLMQKALVASEKRLNRAQQIGKTGYWEWDLETDQVYWSKETYVLYDLHKDEFIPTINSVLDMMYEADREQVSEQIFRALQTKQKFYQVEGRVITRRGQLKYFIAKAEILYNEAGNAIRMEGISQDITEQIRIEQALTASRTNLEAIIENTDDLIWTLDQDLRIITMNSKLVRFWDIYFHKQLQVGDNFLEVLPKELIQKFRTNFNKILTGNKVYTNNRYKLNNKYHWFDISCYPIHQANGQISGVSFMVRDVTKRKNHEKIILKFIKQHSQLKLQQAKLKILAVVKGQEEERHLISMELHDGVGQLLTALNFKMNKLADKLLSTATDDVSLSLAEIMNLQKSLYQEVRRISENLMPQFVHDFPLEKALEQLAIQSFGGTGIAVQSTYKLNNQGFDKSLEVAIFRIVQEIFNNILKHSQATIVDIYLVSKKSGIFLLIKDNGVGFNIAVRKEKLGNGINNIHQRVNLLNGSFIVASQPGGGCQLQIKIPVSVYEKN